MFCPNCGTKINGNETFCPECGNHITNQIKSHNERLQKKQMFNINKIINTIKNIFKAIINFIIKYKKWFIISGITILLAIISFVLFINLYDFTKISWDTENGNANIEYTHPTTITLNVLAYDKEENQITDIKFTADAGEIESEDATVTWKLPNKVGTYTITAEAPSGKKIKKKIKVIILEDDNKQFNGVIQIPEDGTADNDNDGITNEEENKLGTNVNSADSDLDGLNDYYEINVSKTDPLKSDSDNDGINDGDELDLGLDPLKSDSKGDGVKDGDRTLTYNVSDSTSGVNIEIKGKGNIASTTIDLIQNTTISNMSGLMDKIYNFYSNGTIDSAIVKIKYNLNDIKTKGLNENNLTLYYFDESNKQLQAIPTTVDKNNKQIIVTLEHFSKYIIGDSSKVSTSINTDIMFVIDNSISMYSEKQMIAAGYPSSTGTKSNDTTYKRLNLTNKLIDMLTGNYKFGVAEFAGSYANLKKFSDDTEAVKQTVNSMKSKWTVSMSGTNIISALKSGISEFTNNNSNHYLILLTDGKNTKGTLSSSKSTIINSAKANNIKICVIGIGNDIDGAVLNEIAETTGCDYYNATDSSALDEIYSLVGANINYNYVDTDSDNNIDGMIQANSGFIVNRDGFSFQNFRSNKSGNGHCYGMATFAMLYYKNQLPLKLDALDNSRFYLTYFKTIDLSSNGYDLSGTYFEKDNNLYDFKITNPGLSLFLYPIPVDYRDRVEDDVWMIKEKYFEQMKNIGASFSIKDDKQGNELSVFQSASLNIDNSTFNDNVKKDESQLINAIWRLYILQADAVNTSFTSSPDKAFEELKNHLSNGTPIIIAINGNHAINAIKLIQDINDSNKFKIEVYDNNYPGETRYIEVTRSKYNKVQLNYTAWSNEYNYQFKYDSDNNGELENTTVQISNVTIK